MAPRWFRLSLALAVVATACECGDPMPPDDTFDGNVIVGDGTVSDAELDAELDGGTDDSSRDADLDAGSDALDAIIDAGDRCSEPALTVLTATAAADEIGTWAGMIVEITGTATRSDLFCTEITCPQDMPCCNTCTSSVTIEGSVLLVGGECFSPPPGCSGSECAQICRPPLLGIPQRFRGALLDRGSDGVALELFSVEN